MWLDWFRAWSAVAVLGTSAVGCSGRLTAIGILDAGVADVGLETEDGDDTTQADAASSEDAAAEERSANDEGGASDGDGHDAASPDEACAQLAKASCDRQGSCRPVLTLAAFGDANACQARVKLWCLSWLLLDGSGETPDSAEACARTLASATCDQFTDGTTAKACHRPGSLAPNAPCFDSVQCPGQDGVCQYQPGQSCGNCGTYAGTGAPCMVGVSCGYGLVCSHQGDGASTGTCIAAGTAGTACDSSHPCAATLTCDQSACSVPRGLGAPCSPGANSCDSRQDLFCLTPTNVCMKLVTTNTGGMCGLLPDGSFAVCAAGGYCYNETCQPAIADGAMCDPVQGPLCMFGAACIGGVCTIPGPTCR